MNRTRDNQPSRSAFQAHAPLNKGVRRVLYTILAYPADIRRQNAQIYVYIGSRRYNSRTQIN